MTPQDRYLGVFRWHLVVGGGITMVYKDPTIGETKKETDANVATRSIPSKLLLRVKSEGIIGKEKEEEEKELGV